MRKYNLDAAKGILVGLLISSPVWGLIIYAAWRFFQ